MKTRSATELLAAWETFVDGLATGYRFDLDEWRNDVDLRQILANALAADPSTAARLQERLAAADARFAAATQRFRTCVWSTRIAIDNTWDEVANWWYFVVPKVGNTQFLAGLQHVT